VMVKKLKKFAFSRGDMPRDDEEEVVVPVKKFSFKFYKEEVFSRNSDMDVDEYQEQERILPKKKVFGFAKSQENSDKKLAFGINDNNGKLKKVTEQKKSGFGFSKVPPPPDSDGDSDDEIVEKLSAIEIGKKRFGFKS